MKSVQTYNGLNGVVSRQDLEDLAQTAKTEEQEFIHNKVKSLLQNFPEDKKFDIELTDTLMEEFPKSCLNCLDSAPEDEDTEDVGLAKAVSPNDIYQMITDKMISLIEKSTGKGYKTKWKQKGYMIPFNFVSKKPYRGINQLMLSGFGGELLDNPFYLTFKQVEKLGGKVKKGSKGQEVIYYNFIYQFYQNSPELRFKSSDRDKFKKWAEDNKSKINVLSSGKKTMAQFIYQNQFAYIKYYNLFSGSDVEGIDFDLENFKIGFVDNGIKGNNEKPIEMAEAIVDSYPKPKVKLKHKKDGAKAFYNFVDDYIELPNKESFESVLDYYRTLFHEMIHSTGAEKRLDREIKNKFGTPKYAKEELVAEFGAVFLSAFAGIMWRNNNNHSEYIAGWKKALKHLKNDNKLLISAASDAQKASDFILQNDAKGVPEFINKILAKKATKKSKTAKKQDKTPEKVELNKKSRINLSKKYPNSTVDLRKINSYLKSIEALEKISKELKKEIPTSVKNELVEDYNKVLENHKIKFKPKSNLEFKEKYGKSKKTKPTKKQDKTPEEKAYFEKYKHNDIVELIQRNISSKRQVVVSDSEIHKGKKIMQFKVSQFELKSFASNPGTIGSGNKVLDDAYISVDEIEDHKISIKKLGVLGVDYKIDSKGKFAKIKPTQKKQLKPEPAPKVDANGQYALLGAKEKQGLKAPAPKPTHSKNSKVKSTTVKSDPDSFEFFNVPGEVGKFLQRVEKKPKESVAITIDGKQGAGKTTMLFQYIKSFTDGGNKCLFASLEEHPDSTLFDEKLDKYIPMENRSKLDKVGDFDDKEEFYDIVNDYDIIFIDSWQKLIKQIGKIDFDEDLRKKFNSKVFVVIFQQTKDGKTRGGSDILFDGDIIIKMETGETFADNHAYFDKNRYTKIPLEELRYNIAGGYLYNPKETETEPDQDENFESSVENFSNTFQENQQPKTSGKFTTIEIM